MQLPRLRPSRAPRLRAAVLALTGLVSFALLVVASHTHAIPAESAPQAAAMPALRALPAEHVAGMARAGSAKMAAHSSTTPKGGCQVSVHVSQTNSGGSLQQSSSVSSSSSSGSCSVCEVSVQSSQSSANGSNTNVNSTTQSCKAIGPGVHVSDDGQNISVSQDGSSVTITQGGESIAVSSGGASITISQDGHVSISVP